MWNPVLAHSLLFSKSTKEGARLNVPIRRTNRYQQYYMPSQQIYCGRFWNLIQDCDVQSSDYKVYISTPPSPKVENLLPRRGSNPGPAEPEANVLPSEPARRACKIYIFCFTAFVRTIDAHVIKLTLNWAVHMRICITFEYLCTSCIHIYVCSHIEIHISYCTWSEQYVIGRDPQISRVEVEIRGYR